MAVYKRTTGGPWWIRITVRGKSIRRSAGTLDREKAEEFETALRDRYWRQTKLGETVHTWKEAVDLYKKEANWRETTRKTNEYALTFFDRLNSISIAAINGDVIRAARDHVGRSQGPASANRILAVFRAVLRACVRWEWIKGHPPVPMFEVADRVPTWLDQSKCAALLAELPEHLKAPMLFSVMTGLRMSNTRDLTWDRVDLEEGHVTIPASQYKTKRDQRFPLSTQAVALLSALPHRTGRVFLYVPKTKKGDPPKPARPITGKLGARAFRKARKRAGLDGLRWHDLRHTFASWVAQSGASDRVLQALGGWTSPKMVARYAHLKPSDLREYVNFAGTFTVTGDKDSRRKRAKKPVKSVPSI
jgi:integrase